jgi:hypothetical protein
MKLDLRKDREYSGKSLIYPYILTPKGLMLRTTTAQ